MTEVVEVLRRAVRVVIVDPTSSVLLAHYITPDTGDDFWCTPGGALDGDEDDDAAAQRELREELGLALPAGALGAAVAYRVHRFVSTFGGGTPVHYCQRERYYRLRYPRFTPESQGLGEFEALALQEFRWWSPGDLTTSQERIMPSRLIELVNGAPGGPALDLGEEAEG